MVLIPELRGNEDGYSVDGLFSKRKLLWDVPYTLHHLIRLRDNTIALTHLKLPHTLLRFLTDYRVARVLTTQWKASQLVCRLSGGIISGSLVKLRSNIHRKSCSVVLNFACTKVA